MNYARIVGGGIVGGIVFNAVSMGINIAALGERYELLQGMGVFRKEPRLPFIGVWLVLIFLLSIALVWLYAAARPRFGPGPGTAIKVGLVAGLIAGLPHPLAQYSWSYVGGFVSLWQAVEMVAGCTLATLAGAWMYRE